MKNSITLVIDGFKQGGGQEVYRLMLPEFSKKFDHVNLVILESTNKDINIPYFENLIVYRLKAKNLFDVISFVKFFRILHKRSDDFLISSFYRSHIWSSLAKVKKSKLIWLEQNTYYGRSKYQWLLLRILSLRVDKVICVSREIYELTIKNKLKYHRFAPNPINFPTANVVDIERNYDFIFIGRMTEQKNLQLLLKSFSFYVRIHSSNSSLGVVGDGKLLPEMIKLAEELQIEQQCHFYGSLSITETLEILSKSKTLISTSFVEGFGLARLEALACGCCVISTDTGGARDFLQLENKHGTFLIEKDINEIAEKMKLSLEKSFWTKDLINKRIQSVKKFDSSSILNLWLN